MQKVLRKRILRDFKENIVRYLALGILIVLCMYIIVSLLGAADTLISGIEKYEKENKLEDGQFSVFVPLTEAEQTEIAGMGVELEEQFYLDFRLEDGSIVRVYKDRQKINLVKVEQGEAAGSSGEIVLEKRYCEEHGLSVGDSIQIGGQTYLLSGIGCSPDYDAPLKEFSDSTVDSMSFGTAFVTGEAYEELRRGGRAVQAEEYVYAYRLAAEEKGAAAPTDEAVREQLLQYKIAAEEIDDVYFRQYWEEQTREIKELKEGIGGLTEGADAVSDGAADLSGALEALSGMKTGVEAIDAGVTELYGASAALSEGTLRLADGMEELQEGAEELLDEYFDTSISKLVQFVKAEDNFRVGAAKDDQLINKYGGIIAGVIVLVLFSYVLSVFVVYNIEKESSTIGALYALGVRRKELIRHYLCLPVAITLAAGVIGSAVGFSDIGVRIQMRDCYVYYSIPEVEKAYPLYLLVYALVLPPLLAALVNRLVIAGKLNKPALSLMRNEQKQGRISGVNLGKMGFINRFRIRQMLKELRTSLTVVAGMFISLLILMLGVDCFVMCNHVSSENKSDTKYEYMYTFKYPEEKVPEGGYAAVAKTLKKENKGYKLDVTVLGITEDNPYFDVVLSENKRDVVISSAMAQKYGLEVGDEVVLADEEQEMNYAFTVRDITQFSTGFYVFMDIDCMRELFGEAADYYNVVFSDNELDVDSGRLYAVTTREDVVKASNVFINLMMPMVTMMIIMASLIFVVVMYLMMKVMIERSAFPISMVKVFGYRTKEIRKLYLDGNFYTVAVGAAVCIPLSKLCMDRMYPTMVSNVACGMNLTFSWQLYAGIYAGVILLYLIINRFLVGKLKRVNLAEVLKNRE